MANLILSVRPLETGITIIASLLKKGGYRISMIGKWGLCTLRVKLCELCG